MVKHSQGFTLIEVMVVIATLAIHGAVVTPSFIETRKTANEAAAISGVRTIASAQAMFYTGDVDGDGTYEYAQGLDPLETGGMIDDVLGSGEKQGYCFTVISTGASMWHAHAEPLHPGTTGDRSFYIDETGILRFSETGSAGPESEDIAGTTSDPSPSTDHRDSGEAPACNNGRDEEAHTESTTDSTEHALKLAGIFVGETVVEQVVSTIQQDTAFQSKVLNVMDTDQDGGLGVSEVFDADILSVASTVAQDMGGSANEQKKNIGKVSYYQTVADWFLKKVEQMAQLGAANETEFPTVSIDAMIGPWVSDVPVEVEEGNVQTDVFESGK